MEVRLEDGRLILEVRRKVLLEDLLKKITPENVHGEAWKEPPRGREAW